MDGARHAERAPSAYRTPAHFAIRSVLFRSSAGERRGRRGGRRRGARLAAEAAPAEGEAGHRDRRLRPAAAGRRRRRGDRLPRGARALAALVARRQPAQDRRARRSADHVRAGAARRPRHPGGGGDGDRQRHLDRLRRADRRVQRQHPPAAALPVGLRVPRGAGGGDARDRQPDAVDRLRARDPRLARHRPALQAVQDGLIRRQVAGAYTPPCLPASGGSAPSPVHP